MPSSPFPDDKSLRLRVETGSKLAEVFLIDHEFALAERAIGTLDVEVKPGVYKVKAQLGGTTTEELIALTADRTIDLSARLPIASPVPLKGSALTRATHVDLAASESASVDRQIGSGAQILLVTRRWSASAPDDAADGPPPAAPSLHASDGSSIVDLSEAWSRTSSGRDPAAGTTVEVDPGAYLLRWSDSSGLGAEQSLYAVEGWQTQVFLLEEDHGGEEAHRHAVSVLMSEHDFDPGDPLLRRIEEARAALAEERKVATELINDSLFGKFANPMLGLFGAHLMLVADEAVHDAEEGRNRRPEAQALPEAPVEFDQSLFDGVVSNLGRLLGAAHPDVVALATKASDSSPDRLKPIAAPPMLWRSWRLLVEASNDAPDLVPAAVWRQTCNALPTRPFFVWSLTEDQPGLTQQLERQLADVLSGAAQPAPASAGATAMEEGTRRRFSRQLLAPRAVIDELVDDPPA